MKRRVRRLLTVGMSFAVAVAGVMLTSVALATSGAHFFNRSSVNDSGASS